MIAQVALAKNEFPLFGSFSSAGPFVFGPLFYWFNMLAYTLMPFSYQSPWYLMIIAGIATVGIMAYLGYVIEGKRLAIIMGLLVAFCPQFISRSTSLSQHSLIGITTACLLLFFVLYYKRRKLKFAFLSGISLGAALSMHYQALNLLIFFPAILLIPKIPLKKKLAAVLLMVLGFLIPSLPLLYWDSRQSFANIRNMLDYFLIVQYRMYVPNSWKLYLLRFLPDYWANVVCGSLPIAFFLMIVTFLTFIYATVKRKIPGEVFIIGAIFGILILVIRYYRGVRFEGYMIYTAPFIFLLSGWAMLAIYDFSIIKFRKKGIKKMLPLIFLLLFTVILAADFDNAGQFIFFKSYYNRDIARSIDNLASSHPNTKFKIYYTPWGVSGPVYAVSLLMSDRKLLDKNGLPIGLTRFTDVDIKNTEIIGNLAGLATIDPRRYDDKKISKKWAPANPEDVYDDLITRWTKQEKLKATFSLDKYILERLHLKN